jgi:ankyrin repeat protein
VLLKFNNVSLAKQFLDQIDDAPGFLETVDNNGDTALHVAINQGSPELVSYLIQRGAPLDAQNNEGETALHNIVIKASDEQKNKEIIYEIVRILLMAGADQSIQDAADKKPIEYLEYDNSEPDNSEPDNSEPDNSEPEDVKNFNEKLKELFLALAPSHVMSAYPEVGASQTYNGPKSKMLR